MNQGQEIQQQVQDNSSNASSQPKSMLDLLIANSSEYKKKASENISLKSLKSSEISKIMASFSKCRDIANNYYRSTIQPALLARERIYNAKEDYYKEKYPALSELNTFCSKDIKTTIDWMLPSLLEAFIGGDDPVDIKGVNADDDGKASKIQQLLKYQLQRKNSYTIFLTEIWKDALKLNYAVAKVYWKREEEKKRYQILVSNMDTDATAIINSELAKGTIEIVDIKPLKEAADINIITYDQVLTKSNQPIIEYMPPSELRYTPDSSNIQGAKYKAHRKIVTGDYLKRREREGVYQNIDFAISKVTDGNTEYETYDIAMDSNKSNSNIRLSDEDVASRQFELYEAYLSVDFNGDGIFEELIVHAIGDTPISIQKNEMELAPFFIANAENSPIVIFDKENSFTENIEQHQLLKTAIFRQIIINVAKNNSPRTFIDQSKVDMDAIMNNEEYIPVTGSPRESVYDGSQLPISTLAMNILEYSQNEIESQTGSTRYNQGLDSNSLNKTATGITAIMGSAEKRMKHMARMFAETFVIPVMKFIVLLNQKYMDGQQVFRLTDENVVIDKSELDIDYDLIINVGTGAGTREAQIQYLMILINQIYPQLQQAGIVTPQSWYEIVKDLLEKMGIRNVSNYLIDPNSDQAKQMQTQAQQAQEQAKQEQLKLLEAQKQLEIEKARQPRLAVSYEDLPIEAQRQFLSAFGINVSAQELERKILMEGRSE